MMPSPSIAFFLSSSFDSLSSSKEGEMFVFSRTFSTSRHQRHHLLFSSRQPQGRTTKTLTQCDSHQLTLQWLKKKMMMWFFHRVIFTEREIETLMDSFSSSSLLYCILITDHFYLFTCHHLISFLVDAMVYSLLMLSNRFFGFSHSSLIHLLIRHGQL